MSIFMKKLSSPAAPSVAREKPSAAAAVLVAVFAALIAFAVLAAGVLSSCGGGGGGGGAPAPVTYRNSAANGDSYALTVTEGGAGDTYVLTVVLRSTGQVKTSRGSAVRSGASLTLTPSNASPGNTFSVTVSADVITALAISGTVSYTDGSAAAAPAVLRADKTALNEAIADAYAARAGVVIAASSSEVPAGTKYVNSTDWSALNTKLSAAETQAATVNAAQTNVDTAKNELAAAVTAFNGAKQDGTGTGAIADRTALNNKIDAAKGLKAGVVTAADDTSLSPGTVWVTGAVMSAFNTAIAAAEGIAANPAKTQNEVDTAKDTLQTAMDTFTDAKVTVTVVDKAALGAAIAAAIADKTGVTAAADAGGLSPGTVWVPTAAMTAFNTAISTAQGVDTNGGANQGQVDSAVTALNQARTTFNAAKKTVPAASAGTSVTLVNIPAGVTGDVMVGIFSDPDNLESPVALGDGVISGGSVTVTLFQFSGNLNDPLGSNPWTYTGGNYWIVIMYADGEYFCYSPSDMPLSGGPINAAEFEVDGPSGPSVGSISGTLSLTGIATDVNVKHIMIRAEHTDYSWVSYFGGFGSRIVTGNSHTTSFNIPLYSQDDEGTFNPSKKVGLSFFMLYDDGTHWDLFFDNEGEGWSIDHDSDSNTTINLDAVLPATRIISGAVTIQINDGGRTLREAKVGLSTNVGETYYSLWPDGDEEGAEDGTWKLRVPAASTSGTFMVGAEATDGTSYFKGSAGTWDGSNTADLGPITLTSADRES